MKSFAALIALIMIILVIALSGCPMPTDTGTTDTTPTGGTTPTGDDTTPPVTGTTAPTGDEPVVGSDDWCLTGSFGSVTEGVGAGSEGTIVGIVDYQGQQVCKIQVELSQPALPGSMMSCDIYVSEDETFCWLTCLDNADRTIIDTSCAQ